MRLFSSTAFYVKLLTETFGDIKSFFILFIAILCTFGNAMLIMNANRDEDSQIYSAVFTVKYLDIIMNQYMLSLGEFDTDNFSDDGSDVMIWLLFMITTFIVQITFLNMLIAIMGDTFDKVTEKRKEAALFEKVQILDDYLDLIRIRDID